MLWRRRAAALTIRRTVPMSADQTTVHAEAIGDPMTQLDYVDLMLEERESGTASASALLSGLACGLGILALWFAPMIVGFIAIGLAVVGLSIAGNHDRFARTALTIAVVGWLLGSVIAILTGNSPISISLS